MEIYCKEYQDKGWVEVDTDTKKRLVLVELYCDTEPSSLTIDPEDVTALPPVCDFDDMQFAPGSSLVAVEDGKLYLCNTSGEFVEFGGN